MLAGATRANPKVDPDVMRWQYFENPFGSAVGWVWEDDGEVVCHLARLPVPMLVGGRACRGAISVDGATSPSYRGRGLYARLNRRLNDDCAERGMVVAASYLPSSFAPGPHMPRVAGALRVFVRPMSAAWWTAAMRVPTMVGAIGQLAFRSLPVGGACETVSVPEGLDDLWDEITPVVRNGVVRSGPWWRWRYAERPRHRYRFFEARSGSRLGGAAVVSVRLFEGVRVAQLLELMAIDEQHARGLVGTIAGATDAEAVTAVGGEGSSFAGLLRKSGLRTVPRRLERNPLTVNVWVLSQDGEDALREPWTVSWGDMDHL